MTVTTTCFHTGMFAEVDARHPLRTFLPRNLDSFYRYSGSLTTPTCNEVVTWTVFANAIPISEKQVSYASEKVSCWCDHRVLFWIRHSV